MAALADALAVARSVGVRREVALDALAQGPLGGVVSRATTPSSFAIALASKDLDLALRELGDTPAPIAHAAADVLGAVPDRSADITALVHTE
jgi:3-hydroxyisobutyrate dehydrogenase